MPRPKQNTLTEREAEIMEAIWTLESASAEQIRGQLDASPHDSSVRTLLRILEEKGFVRHVKVGKAYVYSATVDREQVQLTAAKSLLDRLFGGCARELVLRLVEEQQLSPDDVDAAAKAVEELSRSKCPPRSRKRR